MVPVLTGAGSRDLGNNEPVHVLETPDALNVIDSPQATAEGTVLPLRTSTQSALAAALNLAAGSALPCTKVLCWHHVQLSS